MAQFYSDPTRETDPYALPDAEAFLAEHVDCPRCGTTNVDPADNPECEDCSTRVDTVLPRQTSWFYWFCFPGCLPTVARA